MIFVSLFIVKCFVQMKRDGPSSNTSQAGTAIAAPAGDSIEFPSEVLSPAAAQPVSEKLIYLCGQCNDGFASLEACKQHMVQVYIILTCVILIILIV